MRLKDAWAYAISRALAPYRRAENGLRDTGVFDLYFSPRFSTVPSAERAKRHPPSLPEIDSHQEHG